MAIEKYELVISGKLSGQFVQNVFHLIADNSVDSPPFIVATAILAKINGSAQMLAKWCDCLPGTYVITSVRCKKIRDGGGPTAILLSGQLTYNQGIRAGDESTSSVCPVIVWLTTLRPSKTGRTFLPGVSEADLDANVLDGSLITAMTAFVTYWTSNIALGTPAITVNGGVFRRATGACDDIAYGRVSPVIGIQRRRQLPV